MDFLNENEVKTEDQIKIEKEAEWLFELMTLGYGLATYWPKDKKRQLFDAFVKRTQEIDKESAIQSFLKGMEERYLK